MSIEAKIEGLSLAITKLTSVLSSDTKQEYTKDLTALEEVKEVKEEKPVRKPRKVKEVEVSKDSEGKSNISGEEVLALAKAKSTEFEQARGLIKAKVSELGAGKISELDQDGLNKLYDFLSEMTKPEEDL